MIDHVITSNGGQVTRSADALYTAHHGDSCQQKVLILPSEWTSITKGSLPEAPAGTWFATEWWLERCIKHKSLINPDHDVLSQPHLGLPINGMFQAHFWELPSANSFRLQESNDSDLWVGQ